VWIASAFGGHGLNTTAMAGELVASAMVEQDDRWRLFIPFGLVWAAGSAGRAATQAAYWSMQFKDWTDEVQTKRVEQVQADIAAGLAPGLAAHAARRAQRKFVESRIGRAGARFGAGIYFLLNRLLAGLRWTGAVVYASAAAVGRLLYVVIMAVALVIGFVAGWVGWGMEIIAAGIAETARAIGAAALMGWRYILVPLGILSARGAVWAWRRSHLGSTRAARAIQAGAILAAARVQAGLIWAGGKIREGAMWSAARVREGFIWSGERLREGALWSAARVKAGANWGLQRGKQAVLLSGARAREGATWTAVRAKEGAAWSARKIADSGRLTWDRVVLPGVKRAASGAGQAGGRIKSEGARFTERARENAIAFGAWSAKLPGVVWAALLVPAGKYPIDRARALKNTVIDARRRHAEASTAARTARKEVDAEPASALEQKPPAKPWTNLLIPVLDRVRAAKNVLVDARKRHAEASAAARAARKEVAEKARNTKEKAKTEDEEPASAEKQEQPTQSKKKKKAKANQDSVEA
jgi:hypothetical protein